MALQKGEGWCKKKRGGYFLKIYKKGYESGIKAIGVALEIQCTVFGCRLPEEGDTYKRCRLCSIAQYNKRSKFFSQKSNL